MKITSSADAAQDAVSGFRRVEIDATVRRAELGSSNVSSMTDAALVANSLRDCITELVSAVKRQADSVTALAIEIEQRDGRDAAAWSAAR